MVSMTNIFPCNIYQTQFSNLPLLKSICENEIQELDFSGNSPLLPPQDRITAAVSLNNDLYDRKTKNIHNYGRLNDITDFVETEAKKYWDLIGYYPDVNPKVWMSWAVMNNYGGSTAIHSHSPNPIVAVFYLDANPEQGNIVFQNPLEMLLSCQPYKRQISTDAFLHEIEVCTGKLLLFPASWVFPHRGKMPISEDKYIVTGWFHVTE
jgi:hypothetical protein